VGRLVGFNIVTPREEFYQHDSGKEPSNVRPECDATALSANGLQTTKELKVHPITEHSPCR